MTGDDQSLHEQVRVALEDLPILERTRFALVAVARDVGRLRAAGLRHEAPLLARAESGAAATAQPGRLDLLDERPRASAREGRLVRAVVAAGLAIRVE